MNETNTAPEFSQGMSEVEMLEYIEKLVRKTSFDPIEFHVTFFSERTPIYQVCPHFCSKGKVVVACFIFCPQNFTSLSQKTWDTFYEKIKDSISRCRTEILVKLL